MNKFHIGFISLIIVILFSVHTSAQTKSHTLNFKPYFGLNTGKTEYIMDLRSVEGGIEYFLKSQLEFPLDQTMVGGEIELKLKPRTQQEWAFYFGYFTKVNDPSGKMYDHDWWNIRTGMTEKISYTESNVEGKNNIFFIEIDKMVLIGKKGSLSLSGGFSYQKIDQDIIGFKGWQLDPDNNYEPFYFDIRDVEALTYEVTYNLPNCGFRLNYFLNNKITFQSRIAYTRALISDFDDHLLRFKKTESDISGNGLLADIAFRMEFGPNQGKGLFVELNGDLTYISASGTSTQSWYGDDPSSEEDDTGLEFKSIPHEVNTTQFRIGVALGLGL